MELKRCKIERGYVSTKKETECLSVDRQHHNCGAEKARVSAGWVMELPTDLLYDILSRLPINSIFKCRCVCKTFLKILADPYFAVLHLNLNLNLNATPNVDHSLIVQDKWNPSNISLAYIFELELLYKPRLPGKSVECGKNISPGDHFQIPCPFIIRNIDHYRISQPWRRLTVPTIVSQFKRGCTVSLHGSCNGLLCVSYHRGGLTSFYICNPILGEFTLLPWHRNYLCHVAAFGFCPKTKQYKVVSFRYSNYCEIHTLGTNFWTRIYNAPLLRSWSFGSLLFGNLHWITLSSKISDLICSLNLETEQFHYISPPSHYINQDTSRRISCMQCGALDGLFSVFYLVDGAQLEVCVMKEYGVGASWTKAFSVNNLRFNFIFTRVKITLEKLLNNGELLIRYGSSTYAYYSSRKGIFRKIEAPGDYSIVAYTPTLISLKDIAGVSNVEVVRRNESASKIKGNNLSTDAASGNPCVGGVSPGGDPQIQWHWLPDEVARLQQAVRIHTYNTKIAWKLVAEVVGTRSPDQCKTKWNYLKNAR